MDVCTYCGRENRENAALCPQCGKAEFQSTTPPEFREMPVSKSKSEIEFVPIDGSEAENDFVTILRCRTLLEADIIVSRLESAGIQAFIPDQFLMQTISWNVNTYGFVRLQVRPSDYAAAKEFLSANEANA
jgi:hypothetical protein